MSIENPIAPAQPQRLDPMKEMEKADRETIEKMFLEQSESFALWQEDGMAPSNENSWTTVLFQMGPELVEEKREALSAYAKSTKNAKLLRALESFDAEAARQVAKITQEEAGDKFAALVVELKGAERKMKPMEVDLEKLNERHRSDPDVDVYIDELELKMRPIRDRIAQINHQLDIMDAVFFLSDEVRDERFIERGW